MTAESFSFVECPWIRISSQDNIHWLRFTKTMSYNIPAEQIFRLNKYSVKSAIRSLRWEHRNEQPL